MIDIMIGLMDKNKICRDLFCLIKDLSQILVYFLIQASNHFGWYFLEI
jgi:hypothetical protein